LVQGVDFEFEELVIAKAAGLALHRFDFVVGALQGGRGDRAVVVGRYPAAMEAQRFGKLLDR
jgi:hypothetical protein